MSKINQPSFGVLRVLGDIELPSKKKMNDIFNNEDTPIEQVADLEQRLKLVNLWKYDKIIHDIQFKKIVDISAIKKPIVPKKFFGLFDNKKDSDYLSELDIYNKAIADAERTNSILNHYKSIFIRQDNKCHFCGFFDDRFMEIHHKNGDHNDESDNNLVGACTLCHRQHHLLWLSQSNQAELGVARIDSLTQTELNHLQRISIVMKDHPKYKNLLGDEGKLGSIIHHLSNNFSKPLHAFMIPDSEKAKDWERHLQREPFVYPETNVSANYAQIELAINSLELSNTSDKKIKNALDAYDLFIDLPTKKNELTKKNPQAADPTESIRSEHKSSVFEALTKYKKDYEDEYERKFNEDVETFNLFELAMALKGVKYKDYTSFKPKYMFLIFNSNIFSEEQKEYYKKMEYFDVDKWGYGDR